MDESLIEPLTRREREVLALLADDRLSNPEIAGQLTISPNSLKWYTHQIYQKLGVKSRRQAVIKARELGMLPTEKISPIPPAHHLPILLTSFLGRDNQVAQIRRMLLDQGLRLVTLTGAGGVGKTRLAIRVAEEVEPCYPHGVWLVELAGISNEQFIADSIAAVFDLKSSQDRDTATVLRDYLRNKHLLLVLDNCEHLIDACAALVEGLLQSCQNLQFLVTSREALKIAGEVPFVVPSLSFPDPSNHPSEGDLRQFEAVQLFMERAVAAQPDFVLTRENARPIARICQKLDGIPLALELAAARLKVLDVFQIADRLEESFQLLTGGSRTALPRHKTMRASIEWSYTMLTEAEQALLRHLSIFAGGWTLDAAEAVCADHGKKELILDLMVPLVDKSLIQYKPSDEEGPRYRMLETVRQYAHEQLVQHGEERALRERYLDYYLSLAEQAKPHLRARAAKRWLDRLERELDNLRLALDYSLEISVEKGLQLAACLFSFWWTRNHAVEGAERLVSMLQAQAAQSGSQAIARDRTGKVARGRALNALSPLIIQFAGVFPLHLVGQEEALNQESQAIFQELCTEFGDAYRSDLAQSLYNQAETVEDFFECRAMFQMGNDSFGVAECDSRLASLYPPFDERALFYAKENLLLREEMGDLDGQGWAKCYLGHIEWILGNDDREIELNLEGIACFEAIGNRTYAAEFRGVVASSLIERGNYQKAIEQCEIIHAGAQVLNDRQQLILSFDYRGWVAWEKKEYRKAIGCCEEALALGSGLAIDQSFLSRYLLSRIAISQGKITLAKACLKKLLKDLVDRSVFSENKLTGMNAIHALGIITAANEYIGFRAVHAVGIAAAREVRISQDLYNAVVLFSALDKISQDHYYGLYMRTLSPVERSEYEQTLVSTRAFLGEETFSQAWESGREMTAQKVLEFALGILEK